MEKEARSKEMVEGEGGGWVANLEVMEDDGWMMDGVLEDEDEGLSDEDRVGRR